MLQKLPYGSLACCVLFITKLKRFATEGDPAPEINTYLQHNRNDGLVFKAISNESLTKFYDSDPFLTRFRNILVKCADCLPRVSSAATCLAIVMWLVKHAPGMLIEDERKTSSNVPKIQMVLTSIRPSN